MINQEINIGIKTSKEIKKGEFVLEYRVELISGKEGHRRKDNCSDSRGMFLYFFEAGPTKRCVDPTRQPEGRPKAMYLNDAWKGEQQKLLVKVTEHPEVKTPHICFFAARDIAIDEELRYDYAVEKDGK